MSDCQFPKGAKSGGTGAAWLALDHVVCLDARLVVRESFLRLQAGHAYIHPRLLGNPPSGSRHGPSPVCPLLLAGAKRPERPAHHAAGLGTSGRSTNLALCAFK